MVQARLAERNISLTVSEDARRYIAEKGYEPSYGARPVKRLIQRALENPLAMKLLDGTFTDGDNVEVRVHEDELVFEKLDSAAAV